MKKKFLTVLATSLALCFSLSAFGCGSGEGGGKSDLGGNPSTPPPPEDPTEAAYTAVKTAYDNAKSYNGAWTIDGSFVLGEVTRRQSRSFDNVGERYVQTQSGPEEGGAVMQEDKVDWKQGDYYFTYKQSLRDGERYAWESNQIPEWELDYSLGEALDSLTTQASIVPNASSFADLKRAWETFASEEIEREKQNTPSVTGGVTLTAATVNNVSTLTAVMSVNTEMSGVVRQRGVTNTLKVEGGRLIGMSVVMREASGENEETAEYNYDISYAFDEAAFNSVAKPEEMTGRDSIIFDADITLCYQGTEWQHSVTDCFDTDDVLTQITNSSQIFYGSLLGYFADEACTVSVEEYSIKELMALEKIYVNFQVPTSGVLIIHLLGSEYNYSENAKIVANRFYDFDYFSSSVHTIYASQTYIIDSEFDKHYVNGIETAAGNLSLEGGQVYIIQSVHEHTDEDVSAFFGAL